MAKTLRPRMQHSLRRLLLVYNPHACSGKTIIHLPNILEYFRQQGVAVDVHETAQQGDATAIAREAAATGRYRIIIAAGGDGTINEVINGMVGRKKNKKDNQNNQNSRNNHKKSPDEELPVLGIIPLGTENVLAQELRLPAEPLKACERIVRGNTLIADLGCAQSARKAGTGSSEKKRYFIITAGIGFDAHVAQIINPELKKLLGSTAYVLTGLREMLRYTPARLRVEMNGTEITGSFVIVGNTKLYGGRAMLTHKADMSDGLLDVCILQSKDIFSFIKFLFGVVIRQHDYFEDVVYAQTKKVRIESDKPVLAHVDCEILGTTPVDITVCPKKIRIVC